MNLKRWITVLVAALSVSSIAAAQQSTIHHKSHKAKKPVLKQVVLPPLPAGPLPQVPLDQLPAVPPKVNYDNGNLSIVAENSTLGDILREVRAKTGASIDVPGNPTERVATHIGPGPAREVLATLLNGTSFNYVMVGSPANPAVLSSVVLSQRPAGPITETAQVQPPAYTPPDYGPGTGRPGMPVGFVPPQTPPQVGTAEVTEDTDADDEADDNGDQDQQQVGGAMQADQNGQPPNVGPRTPQQILQMMQRNQGQQPGQPPQQPPPGQEQQ